MGIRFYYKDQEEAKADIPRYEKEHLPCLELMFEDPIDVPLYFPMTRSSIDDTLLRPFGTLKVKFKFTEFRPMISVGEWMMYTWVDAEVLDVKFNRDIGVPPEQITNLFKIFISNRDGKITDENARYTLFWWAFEHELKMIEKMCNMNAIDLKNVIWDF